jgi:hypothetical protein
VEILMERTPEEMKIKGRYASVTERMGVEKGTRQPTVPFTPYIKVEPGPHEIAERMAENLMYCEIMMFFRKLVDEISDPVFETMLYRELRGRAVARRLKGEAGKLPDEEDFDESKLPENPFRIETNRPGFALHEIVEQREKLLSKSERNPMEKLWLYRLRIAELIWLLDDEHGHRAWLEEDYKKLSDEAEKLKKHLSTIIGSDTVARAYSPQATR